MASHATTSNAAPACQARQQRLRPTGIGSKVEAYFSRPDLLGSGILKATMKASAHMPVTYQ
jgi:hypothetical protein